MGQRKPRRAPEGQEILSLEFEPVIPREFLFERAKEAAQRRKWRDDELALTPRTRTFLKAVDGLWIPFSGGENTVVINSLAGSIKNTRVQARMRVNQKYEASDAPKQRVNQWSFFAANKAEDNVLQKVRDYMGSAHESHENLYDGLLPGFRFSQESVFASQPATDELCHYIYTLKAFVNATPVRRKFVQERWTNVVKNETEWAKGYLENLSGLKLMEIYDEAIQSSRCRGRFWREAYTSYMAARNPRWEQEIIQDIPLSAYQNDPEAQSYLPVEPPGFDEQELRELYLP